MNTFLVILAVAVFFALIALIVKLNKKQKPVEVKHLQNEIDKLTVKTTTPNGCLILSETERLPFFIDAVDAAFDLRDEKAAKHNYSGFQPPSHYTILVFPAVTQTDSDGNYSPAFKVFLPEGDPYNGSIYDKGGYIWAAEQVLNVENGTFAIAENNNSAYCTDAVYNGLEHCLLYEVDRAQYEATKDHSSGGGHPILD